MSKVEQKPYVIYLAEIIYKEIVDIKKKNPDISNIDAIEGFIGTVAYNDISSGKFHDTWFEYLENNNFIDKESGKVIPEETIKLLKIQKDATIKQLIKYPELYYAKTSFPLEISQRAFDFLWRMCESYELWCKEANQEKLIKLDIINGKHISAFIKADIGKSIKTICFNCINTKIGNHLLNYKKKINIIAQIHENVWNNKKIIQLNIKDLIL